MRIIAIILNIIALILLAFLIKTNWDSIAERTDYEFIFFIIYCLVFLFLNIYLIYTR